MIGIETTLPLCRNIYIYRGLKKICPHLLELAEVTTYSKCQAKAEKLLQTLAKCVLLGRFICFRWFNLISDDEQIFS